MIAFELVPKLVDAQQHMTQKTLKGNIGGCCWISTSSGRAG